MTMNLIGEALIISGCGLKPKSQSQSVLY